MNREEKREFKKNAKKRGFTPSEIDYLLTHKANQPMIWEGAKVKLDTVWMRLNPDWYNNKYRKEYKDWVLANKDKEFTVIFDEARKEQLKNSGLKKNPNLDILVCLKEDKTSPQWFFFAGDLILLPGGAPMPEIKTTEDFVKVEEEKELKEIQERKLKQEEKIQDAIQLALDREKL